jgi:hypothetical protein
LHINAATGSPLNVIREIIATDAQAVAATDAAGRLPLHLAFLHGASEDVLLQLLRVHPAAAGMRFPPVDAGWRPRRQCFVTLRTDIVVCGHRRSNCRALMGKYSLDLSVGLVHGYHVWRLANGNGFRGATEIYLYRSFTKKWLVGEPRNFAMGTGWLKSNEAGSASPLDLTWCYYDQAWCGDAALRVEHAHTAAAVGVVAGAVAGVVADAGGENDECLVLASTSGDVGGDDCCTLRLYTTPRERALEAGERALPEAIGPLPVAFLQQAFVATSMLEVALQHGYCNELCLALFRAESEARVAGGRHRGANPLHLAIANGRCPELLGTFLAERPGLAARADASGRCPLEVSFCLPLHFTRIMLTI